MHLSQLQFWQLHHKHTSVVRRGKGSVMEGQRAQQLQNVKNMSTALAKIDQELLDAFLAQGLSQLNLSEGLSTNYVRSQDTYTARPNHD